MMGLRFGVAVSRMPPTGFLWGMLVLALTLTVIGMAMAYAIGCGAVQTCPQGVTLELADTPEADKAVAYPSRFTARCGERILGQWWSGKRIVVPKCSQE